MPSAPHYAIGLPNVGDYGEPRLLVELGQRAEQAGWDGVFIWDHVAYREAGWPVADSSMVIAALAVTTRRIRLGVIATAVPRRRPWKLARELASLDVLSAGRIAFAAGLGSQAREEFAAFGEDPDLRVRATKLDEALEILVGLWSGEPFGMRGEHYSVDETVFLPAPVQRPRIPVWTGGRWPARRPFRRAARWDGVVPTHADVGHADTMSFAQLDEIVRYVLGHRGPDAGPFDVVVEGHTERPGPAAMERVQELIEAGMTWWVEKLGWFHGPVDIARRRIELGPPIAVSV